MKILRTPDSCFTGIANQNLKYHLFEASPTQESFIRRVRLDKRSLTFVGIIVNPRNKNK